MPLVPGVVLNDRYRIHEILGQGGYGAVYRATDERLGIPCAVKENLNLSPEAERQFHREASLLARLRHPNLPRVTHHFVLGGHQYLVMDFIEGEDLRQQLARDGPLTQEQTLLWADQICDALNYLHNLETPVIHRDIKPANVKITPSGQAVLVDFGIAKVAAASQTTSVGAAGLSPGFAPPEQYRLGRTDVRTDIYALGATLFALLTGHVPPDSVDRVVGIDELPDPHKLRPELSPHLAACLLKALEISPERRFQSVSAFQQALHDPLFTWTPADPGAAAARADAGAPLARHSPAPLLRLLPPLAGLLGLAGLVASARLWWVSLSTLAVLLTRLATASASLIPPSEWVLALPIPAYRPAPLLVTRVSASSALPTATPAFTATATPAPQVVGLTNARAWRLYAAWRAGEPGLPFAMAPDGSSVAVVSGQGVNLYDPTSGRILRELQGFIINRRARDLAHAHDTLLVQFADEILRWDINTNSLVERWSLPGREMALSPDGSLLGVRDKYVGVLDLSTRQLLATRGNPDSSQSFAFSPDGKYFALAVGNNAELWDIRRNVLIRTLLGHGEPCVGLVFTFDGARLVSAAGDVWDLSAGSLVAVFDSSTDLVAVDPAGQVIVGGDGSAWDLQTGQAIGSVPFESGTRTQQLAFTPDGLFLLRKEASGEIQVWTIDPNAPLEPAAELPAEYLALDPITPFNISRLRRGFPLSTGSAGGIAFSPDGLLFATWSGLRAEARSSTTGELVSTLRARSGVLDAAFLGDRFLLLLTSRGEVERWEISTGRLKQVYPFAGSRIVSSPQGGLFAVQDKYIQVIDVVSGRRLYELGSPGADFAFSPDGRFLAISAGAGAGLWETGSGRMARALSGHGPPVDGLVFSGDGQYLAAASGDVWDLATGRPVASFAGEADHLAVSHSADLICGSDGSLWDGRTGGYLGALGERATQLRFTADGRQLIWGMASGQVHTYRIGPMPVVARPSGQPGPAVTLLGISPESTGRLSLLGWWGSDPLLEARLLRDHPAGGAVKLGGQTYLDLALNPDGRTIAGLTTPGVDWVDPATGQILARYEIFLNSSLIKEIEYLGQDLLVLKDQAGVERWNLTSLTLTRRYHITGEGLEVSPSGRHFGVRRGGRVEVVDVESGEVVRRIQLSQVPRPFAFSPDGSAIAVARGATAELWEISSGRRLGILRGRGARVFGLTFSPDGKLLLAASGEIWEAGTGRLQATFPGSVAILAVDPRGEIAIGDDGGLWSTEDGVRLGTLPDLRALASSILVTRDGERLLWHASDGRIYVWGVPSAAPATPAPPPARSGGALARLKRVGHHGRGRLVNALWSRDEYLLAVNTTQNVLIYKAESLEFVRSILDVRGLAFDPQGRLLLGTDQSLRLTDPVSGAELRDFALAGVGSAAFSPDGRWLAVGGDLQAGSSAGTLALVRLADGSFRVLDPGRQGRPGPNSLAFTADGRILVASYAGAITLWNTESGMQLRSPITGNTRPGAVSPDGRFLAYFTHKFVIETLERGGTYREINADGTPFFPRLATSPRLEPIDFTFTQSGRLAVVYRRVDRHTLFEDTVLAEWDIHNHTAEVRLDGFLRLTGLEGVFAQEYGPGGAGLPAFGIGPGQRRLFSLTADGVVRVWNYRDGSLLARSSSDFLDVIAVGPGSGLLAVVDAVGGIELREMETGQSVGYLPLEGPAAHVAFASPSVLMVVRPGGVVTWFDLSSGQTIEVFSSELLSQPEHAALSPDGSLFAAWHQSYLGTRLNVFGPMSDRPLLELGPYPAPDHLRFSPDGRLLAVVRGNTVDLWDLQTARVIRNFQGIARVGAIVFSDDGERLVAASGEIWRLADAELMATFDSTADSVILSPDGTVILGNDGTLWRMADGQPIDRLEGVRAPALRLTLNAGADRLVWLAPDGIVEVWGISE